MKEDFFPVSNNRRNGVFDLQQNNGRGNNGVMVHLDSKKLISCIMKDSNCISLRSKKFLGTPGIQRNDAPSFHIHDGPHYEFNKWTPS